MRKYRKKLLCLLIVLCVCLVPVGHAEASQDRLIPYSLADAKEGASLMLANTDYYAGFSQNDLDYKMQNKGAAMEEYRSFAREQVLDFTDEEAALIEAYIAKMEQKLTEGGLRLPPLEPITFIQTTMAEECGAGGYTHGVQIYLSSELLQGAVQEPEIYAEFLESLFWHELFHCLTRCNPDFRADMYRIIRFTVEDEDFPLPPSVFEYHISNPDVEHHNAWASFLIDGEEVKCFTDYITTKHFENPGDMFFDYGTTALVPVDGSDLYYTPEKASNFDEVFGRNTGYVIDPEECLADNFALALVYGPDGPEGFPYPNPEIIEAILAELKT